jgi:uncharacterized protein (DUF305 family)
MTPSRTRAAAIVLSALLAGCAGAGARTDPQAAGPDAAEVRRLEALVRARQDSARMRFTEGDVQFMTNMIGHHAQAITMARMAPTRAASSSIRTLAGRIINAQRDEIRTMQTWLRDRKQAVPQVDTTGAVAGGHDHGGHAGHAMAGMLTAEQLRELEAARGAEFDRLFLVYMIQHHRGATEMVKQLFATHGAGQDDTVFKLASDVNVDQETEIARMEEMLATLVTQGRLP